MNDDLEMDLSSGIACFEAKEFRRALQLLVPLAESGEAEAQFRVEVMCQNGLGTAANEMMALRWMRAAAEQEHPLALHGLGIMYLFGECVGKDPARAAELFRRGADLGLTGSLTTLAMMYEEGLGVERDEERARALYRRAGIEK